MKKLLAFFLVMLFCITAYTQTYSTNVKFDKTEQPALMLELPYNKEVSEEFIITNLKKTGYEPKTTGSLFWKQNKVNGFYVFKNVRLVGADRSADLYFKVEQKSRRQKDQSVIYLLMDKGINEFATSSDYTLHSAGNNFMNGFVQESAIFKHDLDIKAQEEVVKNAEKKLQKLVDEDKKLLNKMEDLQKDIRQNKDDQETQRQMIENEQKKLLELKTKNG